jgi:hypothetical protein
VTKKNAEKRAARARQKKFRGKYNHNRRLASPQAPRPAPAPREEIVALWRAIEPFARPGIIDALEHRLAHHDLESAAFPSDNNDATLTGVGTVEDLAVTLEDVERDRTAITIPFSCRVTGSLADLLIFKADVPLLDDDRFSVSNDEWNDHYVEAQVEVDLFVRATAKLSLKLVERALAPDTFAITELDEVTVTSPGVPERGSESGRFVAPPRADDDGPPAPGWWPHYMENLWPDARRVLDRVREAGHRDARFEWRNGGTPDRPARELELRVPGVNRRFQASRRVHGDSDAAFGNAEQTLLEEVTDQVHAFLDSNDPREVRYLSVHCDYETLAHAGMAGWFQVIELIEDHKDVTAIGGENIHGLQFENLDDLRQHIERVTGWRVELDEV